MNKRILSMLLALVMILSMLPVQALADEEGVTEAQVTEAVVTEPVVTEPVVTEPVVTEPVVTEPVATEPVVTEPEVTVPETTEAVVTEPEEIKSEATEPEAVVTAESVTISQEDALDTLAVEQTLQMTAVVLPENTTDQTVVWTTSDDTIATVDETGLVTGVAVGSVTITAACGEVTGTYELEILAPMMTLNEDALTEGDEEETSPTLTKPEDAPTELLAGDKLILDVILEPENKDTKILWFLKDYKDNAYASVSADLSLNTRGVLSARPEILEKHEVTVRAQLADDEEVYVDFDVTLLPKVSEIVLKVDGKIAPDGVYEFNLNDETLVADGMLVEAEILPEEAGVQDVQWKISDIRGLCEGDKTEDGLLIMPGSGKTGTVTVTATAKDGSGKYAKATIKFIKAAASLEILGAPETMRSGSSVTLTTTVAKEPGLTDRTVLWSLGEGDEEWATIDETTGKLVAKDVGDDAQEITVYAVAKANPEGANDSKTIKICPAIRSITIELPEGQSSPVEYATGGTIDPVLKVEPESAAESVVWSSSNEKVALIDPETGHITMKGAGKVRITCEATDGTRKKGTLNLEIIKPVKDMTIADHPDSVISGEYLYLKATTWTVYDEENSENNVEAANQKVIWSIGEFNEEGEFCKTNVASISSSGRVSAKSVKVNTEVSVLVRSAENGEIEKQIDLTIMPKLAKSFMLYLDDADDDAPMADNVTLNAGEDYRIFGKCYTRNDGSAEDVTEDCTFYSNNTKVAEIDKDGNLTTKAGGTAVITARWTDKSDSNRLYTAKVTLKVTNLVRGVEITQPKNDYLRSGSSVTLKATTWTNKERGIKASNQKVIWSVVDLDEAGEELLDQTAKAASISSSGKLTAKTVTEITTVRVYARSAENGMYSESIDIVIRPKQAYQLSLFFTVDTERESGTVTVPMNLVDIGGLEAELYTSLDNYGDTDDVTDAEGITWTSSNRKVIAIDEFGFPEYVAPGKVTLTAKYVDGKNSATAKITLNLVRAVEDIEISRKVADQELYSGKSLYLVAKCTAPDGQPTNRSVIWSFADEASKEVATINARSGLVSAKRGLTEKETIRVIATAADGYGAVSEELVLTIYPLATSVTISMDGEEVASKESVSVLTNSVQLTADLEPGDTTQKVKWTSSRSSVASVDKDGLVTIHKKGSATIKATALDGSGKSASFILVVE